MLKWFKGKSKNSNVSSKNKFNTFNFDIGEIINNQYEILDIFQGGMGYVYKATDGQITFAVKQPKEELLQNQDFSKFTLREAQAWVNIGLHPNIAYCYFSIDYKKSPLIFLEFHENGTLRDFLKNRSSIQIDFILNWAIQVCHGMEYIHQKGILHRDLKPSNILIGADNNLRITDFGLTGHLKVKTNASFKLSRTGPLGTLAYKPPEQFTTPTNTDKRSDTYSFGICLWEMLCGVLPRKNAKYKTKLPNVKRYCPLKENTPTFLINILEKSVSLLPKDRYSDFKTLRSDLNELYNQLFNKNAPSFEVVIPEESANDLNNRGYSWFVLGEYTKALELFQKACKKNPWHLEASINRGILDPDYSLDEWTSNVREMVKGTKNENKYNILTEYISGINDNLPLDVLQNVKKDVIVSNIIKHNWEHKTIVGSSSPISAIEMFSDSKHFAIATSKSLLSEMLKEMYGEETYKDATEGLPSVFDTFVKDEDISISIWNLETEQQTNYFEGHKEAITSISISPDQLFLATGSKDCTVRIWEISTGKEAFCFNKHNNPVSFVKFTTDNNSIISFAKKEDHLLQWNFSNGEILRKSGKENELLLQTSSSQDFSLFAVPYNNAIGIANFDSRKLNLIKFLRGHNADISSVCFAKNKRFLASGSKDRTVRLWDVETGNEIKCIRADLGPFEIDNHSSNKMLVRFTPDGKYLIYSCDSPKIAVLDIEDVLEEYLHNYYSQIRLSDVSDTAIDRIEKYQFYRKIKKEAEVLIGEGEYQEALIKLDSLKNFTTETFEDDIFKLRLVCADNLKSKIRTIKSTYVLNRFEEHTDLIYSIDLSPNDGYLASSSADNSIIIRNLQSGKIEKKIFAHLPYSLCFFPFGQFISAISKGWEIRGKSPSFSYWKLGSWELNKEQKVDLGAIYSLSFSEDGFMMVLGGESKVILTDDQEDIGKCSIFLIDYYSPEPKVIKLYSPNPVVTSLCFSPDNKFLAHGQGFSKIFPGMSIDDYRIPIWDIDNAKILHLLEGHKCIVNSVVFSRCGNYIISGSEDKTVRKWSFENNTSEIIFENNTSIKKVCISPDNKFIAFGDEKGFLNIVNFSSDEVIYTSKLHLDSINDIKFSKCGNYLFTASSDSAVYKTVIEYEYFQ